MELLVREDEFISRIPDLLSNARSFARPEVSNFIVSAAGLGASGRVYLGANIEFSSMELYSTIHAEEFVICSALNGGERALICIAISHFPCGHCRQILGELEDSEHLKIYVHHRDSAGSLDTGQTDAPLEPDLSTDSVLGPFSMRELLPYAFGPLQLGNLSRLFSTQDWSLVLQSPDDHDSDLSSLVVLALEHANRSYSVSDPTSNFVSHGVLY
jgi:homodimeric cytidine deaminase